MYFTLSNMKVDMHLLPLSLQLIRTTYWTRYDRRIRDDEKVLPGADETSVDSVAEEKNKLKANGVGDDFLFSFFFSTKILFYWCDKILCIWTFAIS